MRVTIRDFWKLLKTDMKQFAAKDLGDLASHTAANQPHAEVYDDPSVITYFCQAQGNDR